MAHHQLNVEKKPTFHLPDMSPRIARSVLLFTQTTSATTPSDSQKTRFPVTGRILADVAIYFRLLQVGMRGSVVFSTGENICDNFREKWRKLVPDEIRELDELFHECETLLAWSIPSFLQDPVFTMIVHTIAYGVQQHEFPQTEVMEATLDQCRVLKEAVIAVGEVHYAIRGLVAAPKEYPLPKQRRRGAAGRNFHMQMGSTMVQNDFSSPPPISTSPQTPRQASPVVSSASSDLNDLFPFNTYPAPSPPPWSPPTTITARGLYKLGLDVYIVADVVDEASEDSSAPPSPTDTDGVEADMEDVEVDNSQQDNIDTGFMDEQQVNDIEMQEDSPPIPTPPFTPKAVRFRHFPYTRCTRARPFASSTSTGPSSRLPSLFREIQATSHPMSDRREAQKSRNQYVYGDSNTGYINPSSSPSLRPSPDASYGGNNVLFALPSGSVHHQPSSQPRTTHHKTHPLPPASAKVPILTISGYGKELDEYARKSLIKHRDVYIPRGLPAEVEFEHIKAWLEGHRREKERQVHAANLGKEARVQRELRDSQECDEKEEL
jgi:hypothetical protein